MSKNIRGYLMAAGGFILLLFNALSYLLDWNSKNTAFTILGLIFVAVGLKMIRKQ